MPIRSAAALFGIVSGASLAVGLIVGAFGTDRASARDVRWWVIAPAVALLLTTLCFMVGFHSASLQVAVALIALGCMGAMIHYGPTVGLIQNLTPVNMALVGVRGIRHVLRRWPAPASDLRWSVTPVTASPPRTWARPVITRSCRPGADRAGLSRQPAPLRHAPDSSVH